MKMTREMAIKIINLQREQDKLLATSKASGGPYSWDMLHVKAQGFVDAIESRGTEEALSILREIQK